MPSQNRRDISMTRVVMVVLSAYPADPRVRREAEALADCGIAVDVICVRETGEAPSENFGLIVAHRVLRNRRREGLFRYLVFTLLFFLAAGWKLSLLSRKHRYQLVQFHNMPDYLVFIGLWKKLRGVPIVLDMHDLTLELFQSRWGAGPRRFLIPAVRAAEKLSCAFSDHIITTSTGFEQRLIDRGIPPKKITLVMNSADAKIFHRDPDQNLSINNPPVFLYHGTVAPRFGIHLLVSAVGLLKEKGIDCRLEINGSYYKQYRKELDQLVHRLQIEDRVHFGAYLPLEEIRDKVAAADIGVVPYISDPFMDLAHSTKGFEYVAMGIPVIASKLPPMTSIFSSGAVRYFEPGNPEDLARQMEYLMMHPEQWSGYIANADTAYEPFSWPKTVQLYNQLISSLV